MDATPVPCGQSVITAKRSDLFGWAGYGYCPSHSRWYWGGKLLIICTCDGTVTGFGLANPKLFGEREQARQMLQDQPANRPAPGTVWHIRRNQDEYTITAVLAHTVSPCDAASPEGLDHRFIEPVPDRELVQIGPGRITEPFHVNHHDRTVNRKPLMHNASPSRASSGVGPFNPSGTPIKFPDTTSISPEGISFPT